MSNPRFSIITASYNAEKYIGRLIKSISTQTYINYEFIVIDGASKDNTVEIIKQNSGVISYWISEKDKGIYDAWNKGLKHAKGDWVMFLGCDDILLPNALKSYSDFIDNFKEDVEYISSRIEMIDASMKPIRVKGWPWSWPFFLREMTVAHPGSLHSKKLFDKYGCFDINYKIVGDYEFLLRPQGKLKAAFLNKVTVKMQEGGASDSIAAIKEHYRAATLTGQYSKLAAFLNSIVIASKFTVKNLLRSLHINAYLRR